MAPWSTLMAAMAAASPTPSTDQAAPTAFEWWSDMILPSVVGAGSIAAAVVAILVAARSNRLAQAATVAATRSNAIAKRANELETQRDARDAAAGELAARQAFADRWSQILIELSEDVRMKRVARDKMPAAWTQSLLLALETQSRGFDSFPDNAVMQMLFRAGTAKKALVMTQVVAIANALIADWVAYPERVQVSIELHDKLVETIMSRHSDGEDEAPAGGAPSASTEQGEAQPDA